MWSSSLGGPTRSSPKDEVKPSARSIVSVQTSVYPAPVRICHESPDDVRSEFRSPTTITSYGEVESAFTNSAVCALRTTSLYASRCVVAKRVHFPRNCTSTVE